MRKLFVIACVLLATKGINAQSRFGVSVGADVTTSSADKATWEMGAHVSGLYDIPFSESFGLQLRPTVGYQKSERQVTDAQTAALGNEFKSQRYLSIPVLASLRISLASDMRLRLNAGPFAQYALFGREQTVSYVPGGADGVMIPYSLSDTHSWDLVFGDKIDYGAQIGLQYEYRKCFVTIDYKRSLRKSILNLDGYGNTLQFGIGYYL